MKKLTLLMLVAIPGIITSLLIYNAIPNSPGSFTVMVTNHAGNHGGSGSVIESSVSESKVLTNAHVCLGALGNGGKIKKTNGEEHVVTGYYLSKEHDLCMLTVAAQLGPTVKMAPSAPVLNSIATITGHPGLMPNVINQGLFGARSIIQVMTGMRKCTPADMNGPYAMYCLFLGGVPIIKTYEAAFVSATIMGGSSGSAVLNSYGELSAVVFAGNGSGLSFAYTVPYEAVRHFLEKELPLLTTSQMERLKPWETPVAPSSEEGIKKMFEACNDPQSKLYKNPMCEAIKWDALRR